MRFIVGTCCTCEENVPCAAVINESGEDWTVPVKGAVAANPLDYACVDHDAFGSRCEGSGQSPQAAWFEER
jgi:hypothetical protein